MDVEGIDVKVVHRQTEAERHRAYRQSNPEGYRQHNASRMRATRSAKRTEFIGVDSEGIGKAKDHRAVLQGVGQQQWVARDMHRGLLWDEIFAYLYSQQREHPKAAFVGFYLSYDFNQCLKSLPQHAAFMLFTKAGKAQRKMTVKGRTQYHPVREGNWEFDIIGVKMLKIRPRAEGCQCGIKGVKCQVKHPEWMYVCDSGSFFQMPFLDVINPQTWSHDPGGPICTQEEYNHVEIGKNKRATADLDEDMKFYNRLENDILARAMGRVEDGFIQLGVRLGKNKWYGPGAAAQEWLRQNGGIKTVQLRKKHDGHPALIPKWFWDAACKSFYGGWFEIFSHGLILGESFNYDINNAYPYAISKLPHICGECGWKRGNGAYHGNGDYVLMYGRVLSKGDRIGAMPHRRKDGSVLRPDMTTGWYWRFEIEAAERAGLIHPFTWKDTAEWVEFIPCKHPKPYTKVEELYNRRLEVGKYSALGMAIKLVLNSIYGKFAQTVGAAPYNNWFYASYITAHCRAQILDAIATHPGKANSVLMVATDGVCFDTPHPTLPISKNLGEWGEDTYTDLCLFKPGVYWHTDGKQALLKVKSRGVPKKEFRQMIKAAEEQFRQLLAERPGYITGELWPAFMVPIDFRMKSCKQALNEGHWESAGEVLDSFKLLQNSDPESKRVLAQYNPEKNRIDSVAHALTITTCHTEYHLEARTPRTVIIGYGLDGKASADVMNAFEILRGKPANYDLPIEEWEWETVWGS